MDSTSENNTNTDNNFFIVSRYRLLSPEDEEKRRQWFETWRNLPSLNLDPQKIEEK